MKKIIEIIPEFKLAGAETMCENLINAIDKSKFEVIAISLYNTKTAITERLENKGVKIYFLDKRRGFDYKCIIKLCDIIKKEKPDMIHTHLYILRYLVIPMILYGKNVIKVHTVHNIADKEIRKGKFINKFAFKFLKVIPVAISETVKKSIEVTYKINPNSIPLIYNGIELENCIKKNDYLNTNNIIHIGRFSEQKNHVELINIFEKCLEKNNNLNLLLIGDGEERKNIYEYCSKKNILKNIKFLGVQKNCFKYLHDSDMFVMPSKWEGMPMTIIEAMGTGLPVVAYPVGGISDMIEENINGFLPENAVDFSEKIIELENNKLLRERIGKENLKHSQLFSATKMAELYCELCEKRLT